MIKTLMKSKIVKNGMWLYSLQIFNSVVPMLTLPYITRILGASQYGVFSYALNIITYFQVFVEYGFGLSGARKVAIENTKSEIEALFSRILISRCFLSVISGTILLIITSVSDMDKVQVQTLEILFIMVIGTVFQQTWLFQGLQIMRFITITNVIARTISVICIFLFVKSSDQVLLYSFLYTITFLINGLMGFGLVTIKFRYRLRKVTINEIKEELRDGWYTFTTAIMTKIFTGIGVTILGYYGTDKDVGIYSAIQKIPQIMVLFFEPIGKIIYPYISVEFQKSLELGISKIKKIGIPVVTCFCSLGALIVCFSKPIILLIYGQEYVAYSNLVLPLILWLVLSITNNFLGIQILVGSGHLKEYSQAFRIGVLAIIICNFFMGKFYTLYGITIASFVSEGILTLVLCVKIHKIRKENKRNE